MSHLKSQYHPHSCWEGTMMKEQEEAKWGKLINYAKRRSDFIKVPSSVHGMFQLYKIYSFLRGG